MTRAEFREKLEKPLLKALERQKLFTITSEIIPASRDKTGDVLKRVTDAKIRYLTLCFGVPVKISNDPHLNEPGADKVRMEVRRNDAAVDSELAALPLLLQNFPLTGPARNPVYGVTNSALLLEIAGGWQETTRPSRRRLVQALSFVVGMIILATVAWREGWEAVLFLLIFLAIWQVATTKSASEF